MSEEKEKKPFYKKTITELLKKEKQLGNPNFTVKDITPEIWAEMEIVFYQNFEFNKLYTPNEQKSAFDQFFPYIQLGLLGVLLIKSFI